MQNPLVSTMKKMKRKWVQQWEIPNSCVLSSRHALATPRRMTRHDQSITQHAEKSQWAPTVPHCPPSPLFNVFNVPLKIMAHHFECWTKLQCHASKCHIFKGGRPGKEALEQRREVKWRKIFFLPFFFLSQIIFVALDVTFCCVFEESCLAIPPAVMNEVSVASFWRMKRSKEVGRCCFFLFFPLF